MTSSRPNFFAASVFFLCGGAATQVEAGRPYPEGKPVYGPLHGTLNLELGFTADRVDGRANLIAPLYRGADDRNMLFLDGNWSGNGDGNENASGGLGFRHRFADPDIILGINAFHDYGDYSGRGYGQFGAGFEILSRWIDFRANGYFPYGSDHLLDRRTTSKSSSKSSSDSSTTFTSRSIDGGEGNFDTTKRITTTTTETRRSSRKTRRTYERWESPMPGFDLELGGLIPYLDCWTETRVFAGYAFFDDSFGDDISCFTARLESRPVPAIVFDVQYKGDSRLVDGENHWFFGARVEIPFDLGNLLRGQSPFAGITQAFTPRNCGGAAGPSGEMDKKVIVPLEPMRNRMNEEIIRNWRPMVGRSEYEKVSDRTTEHQETTTVTQTVTN